MAVDYSASSYRGWWLSLLPIDKRIRKKKPYVVIWSFENPVKYR